MIFLELFIVDTRYYILEGTHVWEEKNWLRYNDFCRKKYCFNILFLFLQNNLMIFLQDIDIA